MPFSCINKQIFFCDYPYSSIVHRDINRCKKKKNSSNKALVVLLFKEAAREGVFYIAPLWFPKTIILDCIKKRAN